MKLLASRDCYALAICTNREKLNMQILIIKSCKTYKKTKKDEKNTWMDSVSTYQYIFCSQILTSLWRKYIKPVNASIGMTVLVERSY